MSAIVAALTGAVANMAALETEFQANWKDLDFVSGGRNSTVIVHADLAATGTIRLFVRAPFGDASGNPVWYQHEDGAYTIPTKLTTNSSEWSATSFYVGQEWSGLLVWASGACTVALATTKSP